MNYVIYNYKGDVISESVSQEELDLIINSEDFNSFEWDVTIFEDLMEQLSEEENSNFDSARIYKPIVE
jgi:hypothetical protein